MWRIQVSRAKLWTDKRDDPGPFDIVGDMHGCHDELIALLDTLGYDTTVSPISHPKGRRVVFLGDLVDRGPKSDVVLETAMAMVRGGTALCILEQPREQAEPSTGWARRNGLPWFGRDTRTTRHPAR